jgi:hypothetical protein
VSSNCDSCEGPSTLVCNGCAGWLCEACAVTLDLERLDFCPTCCRPVFVQWFASTEGRRFEGLAAAMKLSGDELRNRRRVAFRKWARDNPARFAGLRLPWSTLMVRRLTPAQRVEAERYVLVGKLEHVTIEGVKIATGSRIHRQWLEDQTRPV